MATKIFGVSDDLIEVEGDITAEYNGQYHHVTDGVLIIVSDGTLLRVAYVNDETDYWHITVVERGPLFENIVRETPERGVPTDVAYFRAGVVWVYAATGWERLQ